MELLWFRAPMARWCWGGDVLHRAVSHSACFLAAQRVLPFLWLCQHWISSLRPNLPPSLSVYPQNHVFGYGTVRIPLGTLWGEDMGPRAIPGHRELPCGQGDMSFPSYYTFSQLWTSLREKVHLHPSGYVPCPAHPSPCFGGASQQCWVTVMITIFYNCGGGEVGPSGSALQVFNWVFPDCLAFGLSGLHWDKFLTSKLCLLILKSSFFFHLWVFFLFIIAIFWQSYGQLMVHLPYS